MNLEVTGIFAALLLAGAVQGAAGFGFGLVAIALLSSVIEIKDASIILVLGSLSMNIFIFWRLRRHFHFDRVWPMMLSTLVGVPLGVWFLVKADPELLRRVLGVVLLLSVAQSFVPRVGKKRWHPFYLGVPCGVFSGALSGAFATGGPPVVVYVSKQGFDRFRYVATLQVVLGTSALARILCLGVSGLFVRRLVFLSVGGIVCGVTGAWLGLMVLKRIPEKAMKITIFVLLVLLGIRYLVT